MCSLTTECVLACKPSDLLCVKFNALAMEVVTTKTINVWFTWEEMVERYRDMSMPDDLTVAQLAWDRAEKVVSSRGTVTRLRAHPTVAWV